MLQDILEMESVWYSETMFKPVHKASWSIKLLVTYNWCREELELSDSAV